jgi:hypothetical protein
VWTVSTDTLVALDIESGREVERGPGGDEILTLVALGDEVVAVRASGELGARTP